MRNTRSLSRFTVPLLPEPLKELEDEGMQLTPELLSALSPYKTHPNRFGMYELRTRNIDSINYDTDFNI